MMGSGRFVRALGALALASFACSDPATPTGPVSILLIGDSITAGAQSRPFGRPFAEILAEELGADATVTQVGCGRAMSRDWTRSQGSVECGTQGDQHPHLYAARALPNLPADLVVLLLGSNDALGLGLPAPIKPTDYGQHLGEIVAVLLADGAAEVLLMTPPPNPANIQAHVFVARYRDEVLRICGALDRVSCGPDLFGMLRPEHFQEGSLHPNGEGHRVIAEALIVSVKQAPKASDPVLE